MRALDRASRDGIEVSELTSARLVVSPAEKSGTEAMERDEGIPVPHAPQTTVETVTAPPADSPSVADVTVETERSRMGSTNVRATKRASATQV